MKSSYFLKLCLINVLGLFILIISPYTRAIEKPIIVLSVGHAGVFDSDLNDPEVVKLEYRFKPSSNWKIAPGIGISKVGSGASFVFSFVERDFYLLENWVVSPNFGVGFFDDGGELQLGYDVEFRSGIRVAYEFSNDIRLGIELFHLSNGGLGDVNPGTEPAFLSLSIPL